MPKSLRIILLVILVVVPLLLYRSLEKKGSQEVVPLSFVKKAREEVKPSVAIIFDDLGHSLSDLKQIYSLGVPLSVAIIPEQKFSKNIAHIASRCGFSVIIHLPFQPSDVDKYKTDKYRFLHGDLSKNEINSLLRRYLNSIRIAVGVNNHMGSEATADPRLMRIVLMEIKRRGLFFVDSRTSEESVAYEIGQRQGLTCGRSEGFLDSVDDAEAIEEKMNRLLAKAREKGKIIIVAHPKKNTLEFLKSALPALQKKADFITLHDYFDL